MLSASSGVTSIGGLNPITMFNDFVQKSGSTGNAVYYGLASSSAVLSSLATIYYISKNQAGQARKLKDYEEPTMPYYDVAIVGAGPSGSSTAYYLRKGNPNLKVLLLEKKKFPRDKHCGDAVATIAQKHLQRMGVLQEIVANQEGHYAKSGGFVSPKGNSFIGDSAKELGLGSGGIVIAIKRIIMDEKIARAAAREGAELVENTSVETATFDKTTGVWKIECTAGENSVVYYARALVCADGAPSRMARQLGIVSTEPEGTCSRAYVKNNKNFKFDGVVFYPPKLLPGYCAIFREAKGELNFCTYIIPGGPTKNEDLKDMHNDIMKNYPFVAKSLGPEPEIETMKAGPLRLGGVPKSYDNHVLVVGDAAGFIDPLTGEGIHFALESGEMAAASLLEGFQQGDLSTQMMKRYQTIWKEEWGLEFYWSMKMSLLMYRCPILLDAAALLIERRGSRFMAEWSEVMTGTKSKTWFLRLDVWPFLCLEIFRQVYRNLTGSGAKTA